VTKEEKYKATLEQIRAELAQMFPEPYLATAPDSHLAAWIWRKCDAALAVYSTMSDRKVSDQP
jgi:hypothetical protein